MKRRNFLLNGSLVVGALSLSPVHVLSAAGHVWKMAPLSMLPDHLRNASPEISDAYRFVIFNRETLSYIPCYCGCVNDGHTSNASCYLKDNSPLGRPQFDFMSTG